MKTPQVEPSWATGIYIGNGVVATQTRMTDDELTYAMNGIRETMKLHAFGSPYHDKLMREYDEILEQMSQNCLREYHKRYGE